MTRTKKTWADLTPTQQRVIVAAGAAELVLTGIALRDMQRRSRSQVRGPKLLWRASFAVQPFGPLAYLLFGRR